MVRILFLCWFILFGTYNYAQERDINTDSTRVSKSKLTISDFAQAQPFWSFEQHSNFVIKYGINSRFSLELQGYYDTHIFADVFRIPIIAKVYLTKRMYLFSGIEIESEKDKFNLGLPPVQLKLKNGMGYDVNTNFQLQFVHDLHFNKSNVGIYGNPELFTFSGKIKF